MSRGGQEVMREKAQGGLSLRAEAPKGCQGTANAPGLRRGRTAQRQRDSMKLSQLSVLWETQIATSGKALSITPTIV